MKVLVIQPKIGIGDMIIYLSYIHAISKTYKSSISILVKDSSKAKELLADDKLINEILSLDRAKDKLKNFDKDGASTLVGAKKEDYEYLGVANSQENTLSAKLKEKGGKMDMKDLMQAIKG